MKAKPSLNPPLWCLKSPKGKLCYSTLTDAQGYRSRKAIESEVWGTGPWGEDGFNIVSKAEGIDWKTLNWKRWDESIASAKALGWTFVKVRLVEEKD